ncbi:hypothetical protein LPA49_01420 [Pseudoalteromonas sp. MB41]|uniref:hypothetical protein n=1 Tax=Pseudoalteromonas sp. MB41 TaxID=2896366 RepID=UPI001E5BF35B|nr:hypothetical protein [Pseudoalteromonas sp. MB41]MCC9659208.1 hypothetical protein [Pseudoalteromonas sp. MB41]
MYIYHVSIDKRLHKIRGNKFRALEYHPVYEQKMHKELHKLYDVLKEQKSSDSIFRFCFYDTHRKAIYSLNNDFKRKPSHILRFKKSDIDNKGFNWQWDEGFNVGEAHLYWVKEKPNSNGYSELGIDFSLIDIEINGQWLPLTNYIDSIRKTIPNRETIQTLSKKESKVSSLSKMVNKLFKRDK